jgi:hypothetical protein
LWVTGSLRGITVIDVTVEAAEGGYHSGEVGGIIPETFRIMRNLLDRIDDSATGQICPELTVEVPENKRKEAEYMAQKCGETMYKKYNVVPGLSVMN